MTSDHSAVKNPHVLTVAGFDSGAGAGIQADLMACAARGVYCSAVITAVTAQNTVGVQGVNIVPEEFVAEQMKSVVSDMDVDVAALVVDPVMVSTSGEVLAGPSTLPGFRYANPLYIRLSKFIVPPSGFLSLFENLFRMLKPSIECKINVLVKGGDLPDSLDAVDVFFDGEHLHELRSSHIKTRNTHGTGCTLASCIAAELAKGSSMLEAVKAAKFFVETALDYSKDIFIGNGPRGPFDHLMRLKSNIHNSGRQVRFNPSDLFLEKDIETGDFLEAAKSCLQICRAYGVPLLINDRIDVALASDADGVHIGQSDMPAHVARSLLAPGKIIAVSCKIPEQAQQAWLGGADYIGCGGV
ncbi:hypothetical protein ACFX2K_044925 [Malus domestica]